jgi:hypothetical protein
MEGKERGQPLISRVEMGKRYRLVVGEFRWGLIYYTVFYLKFFNENYGKIC